MQKKRKKGKINILYMSRTSKITGPENILIDILSRLNKDIFSPAVILPDDRGPFYKKLKSMGIDVMVRNMPFLRVTYNPFLLVWFFINICISNISFFSILKRRRVDMVVCNTIQEALFVFLPVKILKRKMVICFKNILDSRWKKKIRAGLCDIFADGIIAVSEKALGDYISFGRKNRVKGKVVKVIYDGIDFRGFRKDFKRKDILKGYRDDFIGTIIVNIGNLTELKGQMLLLEALNSIRDKNPNIKALLLGDVYHKSEMGYKKRIEEYIGRNHLEKEAVMLGYRQDIRNYLDESDVLVHCPVKDDAFPRVILEAFCFGRTVIATRVGGIPEMVKDGYNGFLCDSNKDDLVDKILYVLGNIDKLAGIGKNAMNTAEKKFSIEKQVAETEEIYYKILKT